MEFILASASPRREELLKKILDDFKIIPSQIAESIPWNESPIDIAMNNALEKALDISAKHPDALVIGADTVIALEDKIMGKPKDLDDAMRMLEMLSGKTHQVVTGIAMVLADKQNTDFEFSDVTFRELTKEQIEAYVQEKQPLDKAGSYGIQEVGDEFVEHLEGKKDNVMGLPVNLVADMLGFFGL
ncbi:MAG: septum formation protein Maf [Thermoplasmata archaeon]|nr:septum formation protein Maf [Thermoplasmata archaeon]